MHIKISTIDPVGAVNVAKMGCEKNLERIFCKDPGAENSMRFILIILIHCRVAHDLLRKSIQELYVNLQLLMKTRFGSSTKFKVHNLDNCKIPIRGETTPPSFIKTKINGVHSIIALLHQML